MVITDFIMDKIKREADIYFWDMYCLRVYTRFNKKTGEIYFEPVTGYIACLL